MAVPVVLPRERMLFSKAGLPGMYRAVLRFGYQERIDLGPEFVAALVHEVRRRATSNPGLCMFALRWLRGGCSKCCDPVSSLSALSAYCSD